MPSIHPIQKNSPSTFDVSAGARKDRVPPTCDPLKSSLEEWWVKNVWDMLRYVWFFRDPKKDFLECSFRMAFLCIGMGFWNEYNLINLIGCFLGLWWVSFALLSVFTYIPNLRFSWRWTHIVVGALDKRSWDADSVWLKSLEFRQSRNLTAKTYHVHCRVTNYYGKCYIVTLCHFHWEISQVFPRPRYFTTAPRPHRGRSHPASSLGRVGQWWQPHGHTKTQPAFPSSIDRSELPHRFCTDRPTSEMAKASVEEGHPSK